MHIRLAMRAGLSGLLAFFCAAASAQATSTLSAPSDPATAPQARDPVVNPAAAVPAVRYRSVFVDTPKGVETEEADWRKANAEVGQFKRGHVDILQWENKQGAKP